MELSEALTLIDRKLTAEWKAWPRDERDALETLVNHVLGVDTPSGPETQVSVEDGPIVTKTGKALTDADIEALADEAERGYDVSQLRERGPRA